MPKIQKYKINTKQKNTNIINAKSIFFQYKQYKQYKNVKKQKKNKKILNTKMLNNTTKYKKTKKQTIPNNTKIQTIKKYKNTQKQIQKKLQKYKN